MRLAVRLAVVVACVVVARGSSAQATATPMQLADRGPAFFSEVGPARERVDARNAAVFGRRVSVALHDVPLAEVLREIARQSGLRFVFSEEAIPQSTRVSLEAKDITVAAALTDVLFGAGVDVELSTPTQATLVRRAAPAGVGAERGLAVQPGGGTISGTIADTVTREVVPYVTVSLDDGAQSVKAGAQGQYAISGVAAGEHRVTAKRLGFIAKTRTVVVEDGKTVTLNFVINRPPTKLDEVVTSAVGDQRRYQVGNVIATVNVDSIAPTVPAMSVTDLLSGRVPGLSILQSEGLAGSGQAIRIRGVSSVLLQSDPIIIVDGIRVDNQAGGVASSFSSIGSNLSPSRINDIDFSEIETIDVLKGPAASTEYGTDAANGVIVIKTKRGTSGSPRWTASAEQEADGVPQGFPEYYYSWGHTTPGAPSAVECPFVSSPGQPSSSTGTCAVDSVTHFNPFNVPAYSIYTTGFRNKYDLSVGGGSDVIRYYLAGGLSNETGDIRVPPVFRGEAAAYGFPSSILNPNNLAQRNGHANTTVQLSSTMEINVNAAYLSTHSIVPSVNTSGNPHERLGAPTQSDSAHNYGYGLDSPLYFLGQSTAQQTDRLQGGVTLDWRPAAWLAAHATVGIDHESQQNDGTILPQSIAVQFGDTNAGALSQTIQGLDVYSADLRASAVAPIAHWLRATTSIGLQFADSRTNGITAYANQGVGEASLTLNGVSPANVQVGQIAYRSATLGGYVEEQLGFADRLFLIGAMRIDGGSGFGNAVHVVPYPKVSASYLAVTNGPTTVRLRGAVGVAGRQPYNGAADELTRQQGLYVNGGYTTGYYIFATGNPNLKPERSDEFEGGIDLGFWSNRLSIEFTGYQKTTHDMLYDLNLGWDDSQLGGSQPVFEENIGEVRNSGLEGSVTAIVIDSRPLVWSLTVNGSVNHNLLVHLAPGAQPLVTGTQQQHAGFPLYGYWGGLEHYSDLNHDGILEANEVTTDSAASYMGSSAPTRNISVLTHVGLFHSAITVGALFDYQGGYRVYNQTAQDAISLGDTREQNVKGAPLWMQARAVALEGNPNNLPSGFFEDGTMVRFRELSLSYNVPQGWARAVHVRSLSLTAAVRNVALWTRYSSGDPEVGGGGSAQYSSFGPTAIVNNDVRSSSPGAVPLPRSGVLRLNVGF